MRLTSTILSLRCHHCPSLTRRLLPCPASRICWEGFQLRAHKARLESPPQPRAGRGRLLGSSCVLALKRVNSDFHRSDEFHESQKDRGGAALSPPAKGRYEISNGIDSM